MFDESRTETLIDRVRAGLAGGDVRLETPFGSRPLFYADYTASGRALAEIARVVHPNQHLLFFECFKALMPLRG